MSGDRAALVGRERHLGELSMLVDGVRAGHGHLVVLSGEAGAGKTRLAEEAAALASDARLDVAWATGWGAAAAPLSTWSDLLRGVASGIEPDGQALLASTEVDPETARAAFVRSLVAQLREAVRDRHTLLIVDDVQWCDPLSLHALEALVASIRSTSIGLVATLRDDGTTAHGTITTLTQRGRHLVVPPLTETELGELALHVTGRSLSPPAIARLRDRSAGNVLFATELLANAGTDTIDGRDVPHTAASTAAAMFASRLSGLSPECQRMLETACVIGRRFRLDVLAETLGAPADSVLDDVGEAHAAGFVRPSAIGMYEFSHPLMAEACYATAGLPRRIRLHRDVGEAMERLREQGLVLPATELAHHFAAAAGAGVAGKAVHYAIAAGRENMDQLGYEDAARNFGQALAALDLCPADDATRADLLLELGDAHSAAGDLPSSRTAYEAAAGLARARGWPERLARGALGIGSGPGGFEVPAFDREQIALLEEAASVAVGTQRAQVLARLSVALSLDVDGSRRARLSEEAVAAARDAGDALALGYALASWCDVIAGPADLERRIDTIAEILACASKVSDTRLELLGRRLRVVALLEAGAITEVDEEIAAFANRADRLGQVVYSWYVPLWRSMRATMEGRLQDAAQLRRQAAALGEAGHSENAFMLTGSQQAMLQCELGDPSAVPFFEDVTERWPGLAIMTRPGLAYSHAASGELARANDVLAVVNLDHCTTDALGSEWLPSLVMLAYAAARAGAETFAQALYATLLPHRDRHAIDGIGGYDVGSVERPLGMLAARLGDRARATEHFDAALAQNRRIGARLLVAGTLRDAGRYLDDASMLASAKEHYAALGLDHVVDVEGASANSAPAVSGDGNVFRRDGEMWVVGVHGTTSRVRDTKGMSDLARLLTQPGTELHALDLVADGATLLAGPVGDSIDDAARRDYRARLVAIEAELTEADERADMSRSEQLHSERDMLIAELSDAYGLGGRARRRGDSAERARSAVTQRIRVAIGRIEAVAPDVASHLRHSIRTGTFCSYQPEHPIEWQL